MQLYRHGSAGMMVPLVKAGAVGDGLSACRRYTMMGGVCVLHSMRRSADGVVSAMTKSRLSGSSLRHNTRYLR